VRLLHNRFNQSLNNGKAHDETTALIGGVSGPTTYVSETNSKDTFETGSGAHAEFFYDWSWGLAFLPGRRINRF
jgi:hypothetical protein